MKQSYAKNIKTTTLFQGLSSHVVRTSLKDLVTLEMSLFIPPRSHAVGDVKNAEVTAELLDAGTQKHTKEQLRKLLEERGAMVSFGTDSKWLSVHVRCLKDDTPFILSLVGEMLHAPLFKNSESTIVTKRMNSDLELAKSSTGSRANRALRSMLFNANHVYFAPAIEDEQKVLKKLSGKDALIYHRGAYGKTEGYIVAVGDVDEAALNISLEKVFKPLKERKNIYNPSKNDKKRAAGRAIVSIKDQASVDLRMGHALSFTRKDPEYIPFMVLMDMLGGGFSAHLMQTVRERDGLTYGIYAGVQGFSDGNDGWWQIGGTFAPELYKKGEEVVRKELKEFLEHGITEEAVARKKEEILGTYKIGLATSRGLAGTILSGLEEGFGVEHVDTFVDSVERVTLHDIEKVKSHIDMGAIALAAAGSIDMNGNPL